MSNSCAVESCQSTLDISCHCCEKKFCPDHLDEHYEAMNKQLTSLSDQIKTLSNQILEKTMRTLIGNCLDKLDTWRDESYKLIKDLYEKTRQELQENYRKKTENQQTEIEKMQLKINKLIHENDATQKDIEDFQTKIEKIQHEIKEIHQIYFQINIRPLEFYENFISIDEMHADEIDFTVLLSPYKTIDSVEYSGEACAANDNCVLIQQGLYLELINKQLTVIKKIPWEHDSIYDMCWSSTLNGFIIVACNKKIYFVNENLTSIQPIEIKEEHFWWRCTCSDKYLYLTLSHQCSDIFQFDLLSSFKLIKRWKLSHLYKERDIIFDIVYNNETFALLIKNQQKTRMELRSATTFDRIWIVQLDIKYDIMRAITFCCLLNSNDWLVLDTNNSSLLHINQNGKIKSITTYNSMPTNAILFGSNILAIKNEKCWNFHHV